MVPEEGIEPTRALSPPDFESGASASFTTPARNTQYTRARGILTRHTRSPRNLTTHDPHRHIRRLRRRPHLRRRRHVRRTLDRQHPRARSHAHRRATSACRGVDSSAARDRARHGAGLHLGRTSASSSRRRPSSPATSARRRSSSPTARNSTAASIWDAGRSRRKSRNTKLRLESAVATTLASIFPSNSPSRLARTCSGRTSVSSSPGSSRNAGFVGFPRAACARVNVS